MTRAQILGLSQQKCQFPSQKMYIENDLSAMRTSRFHIMHNQQNSKPRFFHFLSRLYICNINIIRLALRQYRKESRFKRIKMIENKTVSPPSERKKNHSSPLYFHSQKKSSKCLSLNISKENYIDHIVYSISKSSWFVHAI